MNKSISTAILLVILFFAASAPVFAVESGINSAPKAVTFQNRLVPEGQRVRNVLLVGQDGVIAGEVEDEVVVIKGNLILKSTAKVADRVFVIGGELQQEPGAQVGKGVFNISTSNAMLNSLLLGIAAFAGIELLKFILSTGLILAVLIVMLTAPVMAKESAATLNNGLLKSVLIGLLGLLCFILLTAALAASIWGIPLALIMLLLFIVLLVIGFSGVAVVFGELFKPVRGSLLTTAMGSLLLAALLNLPVLGAVWVLITVVLAIGSTIQVIFNKKSRNQGGD